MCGVDGAQARSGGQWQALLTYPGKLAIGATFDLAADQRGRILLCHLCKLVRMCACLSCVRPVSCCCPRSAKFQYKCLVKIRSLFSFH